VLLASVLAAATIGLGACADRPAASGAGPSGGANRIEMLSSATVTRVVDGDTVELTIGGQTERVRLVGLDAPESVSPTVPEQCYGAEASRSLRELLPAGTEVRLERDVEARDRYGRLLLYLYRAEDGLFVNQWLIASGLADAVTYEPNDAFHSSFEQARQEARGSGTGLWGSCDGPDQPLR
jgi:micrococcal nuclease